MRGEVRDEKAKCGCAEYDFSFRFSRGASKSQAGRCKGDLAQSQTQKEFGAIMKELIAGIGIAVLSLMCGGIFEYLA